MANFTTKQALSRPAASTGPDLLDGPRRREAAGGHQSIQAVTRWRNCLVIRALADWKNDNETFCPFDCALSFSRRGRLYDCASVLSSPASSLLASWRWRLLLELLSDLLAGARERREVNSLSVALGFRLSASNLPRPRASQCEGRHVV
jgi:hypothetical protein